MLCRRRQHLTRGAAGLALVASLIGAGASSATAADGGGGLLGGLLGGGSTSAPPQATTISGHVDVPDQRLRRGCRTYTYSYRLQIPQDTEFDFEVFVTDPRGISQASDVILSGADPLAGTKHFEICRSNTEPGRFVMHAKLDTNDGAGPTTSTKVADATFRLYAPRATHPKHKKRHHRA